MKPVRQLGASGLLADAIERFLTHKRAVGRKYTTEEVALRLLERFLRCKGVRRLEKITPGMIDNFLSSRPRKRPRSYNHLLGTVARFFTWCTEQDLFARSPVQARPKRNTGQRIPFIFDRSGARKLLGAARSLKDIPRARMRGKTYHAILALLYGLGLRVGEACRLCLKDIDFDRRLLVIRQTKFYKSRLVPFGPKMEGLLREYIQARGSIFGAAEEGTPLFSFTGQEPIEPTVVSRGFRELVTDLGIEVPPGCSFPRLHDLRHAFAVGTLLRWYRAGVNPASRLLKLATFLGHVDPMSTATYLTITSALFQEANRRFEAFTQPLLAEGISQ